MGKICAICVSENKGTVKTGIAEALLVAGHGIRGDAHAGNWHRQVSLLAKEDVLEFAKRPDKTGKTADIAPGAFGENLLVEGIDLNKLICGTRLKINDCLIEITQRGKECHDGCEIKKRTGDCIMPRAGVFAKVVDGGLIRPGDEITVLEPEKDRPIRAAVITLSDRCAGGESEDKSGPVLAEELERSGYEVIEKVLLPDDKDQIKRELIRLSDRRDADLILTTGGTGLSDRDVTPEATVEVSTKNVPGISEAMRAASAAATPYAMLSRGVSVIRNHTLIINLPGSPGAVRECFDVIRVALGHGLRILKGLGE